MKILQSLLLVLVLLITSAVFAQDSPRYYKHKVVLDSVLQTKNYTYMKVREVIDGKDSSLWLALPLVEPTVGMNYYYESGLQMGEFQSKELNRTFSDILFLGGLSTSPEFSSKTIIPVPASAADTVPVDTTPVVKHTVVVKEVLQTSGYSYLRVMEGDKEEWLAIVKIPAKVGQIYTYDDAAPMTNFFSKELNRNFKEILFLAKLTLKEEEGKNSSGHEGDSRKTSVKAVPEHGIKIEAIPGGTSIADLYASKQNLRGKSVKVKGQVVKFSSDIMGRNWIHLQDGTQFSGKFDLTVTSDQFAKEGDVITIEGIVDLDKDFGSGYFFEVILEKAKVVK